MRQMLLIRPRGTQEINWKKISMWVNFVKFVIPVTSEYVLLN